MATNSVPSMPSTVIPTLRYRDAHAAIEWLCTTLGFTRHAVYEGPENTVAHAQLTISGGMIMLGSAKDAKNARAHSQPDELNGTNTGGRYIFVSDSELDQLFARTQASESTSSAKIIRPVGSTDYGSREFACTDPEGHVWTIGTYNPWT